MAEKNTPKAKVCIIPNPLVFPISNRKPCVPPQKLIKENHINILSVGRLTKQTGHVYLISAFANLSQLHNHLNLVILGEGEERGFLENRIRQLDLEERISLPGSVGNLDDWYRAVDMYVMSSHFEGFPNSLLEAMAYGLPVVSYDCPAEPNNLISHRENGLLVSVSDGVDGLGNTIEELISNDHLRHTLSKNAINVRHVFAAENIIEKWNSLIQSL